MTHFHDLGLAEPILRALAEEGYERPTPIQVKAIPPALANHDVVGIAQTGTGKTAAFALPILHRLAAAAPTHPRPKATRVLVLCPTRELGGQIVDSFQAYGRHLRLKTLLVIGGVPMGKQIRSLAGGVDVLVATPGRLLDLYAHRAVTFDDVSVLVLDEADRMLDMGFIHDIRKIVALVPAKRQTLFFSATMPKEISELAERMLKHPVQVSVTPPATTVEMIDQRAIRVEKAGKPRLLADLLGEADVTRALVFTRTKHGADRVVRGLNQAGIPAEAIHGNKTQGNRERTMSAFRAGSIRTLVATDIAARGIDVDGITHVVNYELPNIPETYVHRIGRTARAGASGVAISLVSGEEMAFLRDIEKLTKRQVPLATPNGTVVERTAEAPSEKRAAKRGRGRQRPAAEARPGNGDKRQRNRGQRNGKGPRREEAPRNQPSARSRPDQGIAGIGFMAQKPRRPGMQQGSASQ